MLPLGSLLFSVAFVATFLLEERREEGWLGSISDQTIYTSFWDATICGSPNSSRAFNFLILLKLSPLLILLVNNIPPVLPPPTSDLVVLLSLLFWASSCSTFHTTY